MISPAAYSHQCSDQESSSWHLPLRSIAPIRPLSGISFRTNRFAAPVRSNWVAGDFQRTFSARSIKQVITPKLSAVERHWMLLRSLFNILKYRNRNALSARNARRKIFRSCDVGTTSSQAHTCLEQTKKKIEIQLIETRSHHLIFLFEFYPTIQWPNKCCHCLSVHKIFARLRQKLDVLFVKAGKRKVGMTFGRLPWRLLHLCCKQYLSNNFQWKNGRVCENVIVEQSLWAIIFIT